VFIWRAIVCLWVLLWIRAGLCYPVYRLRRFLSEFPHRRNWPKVKEWTDYPRFRSVADGWGLNPFENSKGMYSYPSAIQYLIDSGEVALGGCKNWVLYFAACMSDIENRSKIFGMFTCQNFCVMRVSFMNGWKLDSHSVCLFEMKCVDVNEKMRYGYVSNWRTLDLVSGSYAGRAFYSIDEVVADICGSRKFVGKSFCNLKCRRIGRV
jgi:hypothetical protein